MKKFIVLPAVVLVMFAVLMCGCNKQIVDLNYAYDYAIVQRYDGEQRIELKSWKDYDGEQLQLTDTDGNVYLVSSINTILVKEK